MPDFLSEAIAIQAEITQFRHELHEHPELGLELPWTQQKVLEALAGLPLEITLGARSTSINAVLRGGAAPAEVADRAVVLLTFNHSATAWFDDCVISEAIAVYCQLGWASLQDLAGRNPGPVA